MENQEDFTAQDGKLHIISSEEIRFMNERLPFSEFTEFINAVIVDPESYDGQNITCLNLIKDEMQVTIAEIENEESFSYHIAVKNEDETYNVFDFDITNNPMTERKPTPCWSYNVIDRRPNGKNQIVSHIETFFHNFWYCPNHL